MRKYIMLLVFILICVLVGCSAEVNKPYKMETLKGTIEKSEEPIKTIKETAEKTQSKSVENKNTANANAVDSEKTILPIKSAEPVIKEEKKEELIETLSQKNAVRRAEQYLNIMAFSKSGLIEQLEFEGFSNQDATYAVNKLNVNWNEQAIKKGKQYLDIMAFSKSGLVEQLEFDGFSYNEATYAVNQLNVNWKEQAVKKAKQYLEMISYSRSRLIEQLEFEGFTSEEANFAVDQIGF